MTFLVFALPAFAQTNPQRTPPAEPDLRFVGRMQDGKAVFLEAKTFGRWQDNGYGWMILIDPVSLEPIWVREIVNCQTKVMTDDYIVWMDTHLKAWASSEHWLDGGGNSHPPGSQQRIEREFAASACTGKPALDTYQRIGSLRAAVDFTRRLPD